MKKLSKEYVGNIRLGDATGRAPKMDRWNSFSGPIKESGSRFGSRKSAKGAKSKT